MTLPPVSRRDFLGASAGSAALLASGPLFAQADALPSRKVTVGIMGLKRGMEVAAALEKQPGVVIKYVCDVDSRRADAGKAKLEKSGPQRPQAITDFRRILDDKDVDALFCEVPNHWHGPATILGCAAGKLRSGDHFGVNAQIEKGHRSTLLCHLGNIAYRTQRTLKCDPENGHIQGDEAAMAFWKREYEPGWTPVV